ncbi:MAG: RNA methyltransferase [Prevotellaceae bacterium]|jgi:TrmH family RNA methyltransferase|nr:RNA methyltransferase [Prevotellaceae bacterium]
MLSKAKIKQIKSLEYKKFRDESGLFVAEGEKSVCEILQSNLEIDSLFCLSDALLYNDNKHNIKAEIISENEMKRISFLKTPPTAFVVAKIPDKKININDINNSLNIILDDIQDPGNLGTIIRLCDWFGIQNIICSHKTADCFSPKTVQATMGAICRVNVFYVQLNDFFDTLGKNINVYGTFLEGENIYSAKLSPQGLIIMGNEGKGISSETEKHVTQKLCIPCLSDNATKTESLNVSVAAAIVCSEFKRRNFV